MAVVQRNKRKVCPVMDFRELNTHIDAFTADSDVCADKLRVWRRQDANVSVVDLAKAYLQIRIRDSLWPYQTVSFRGRRYCLTRLGFGLNVAPLIMRAVLDCVLSQDPVIWKGTSAYVDDILVNEDVVTASHVEQHLEKYELTSTPHVRLAEGGRALDLRVWGGAGRPRLEERQCSAGCTEGVDATERVFVLRQANRSLPFVCVAANSHSLHEEEGE